MSIDPHSDRVPPFILDGGLATELERRGHDLNHPLWSARILLTEPEAIREVHESFLEAGADIVTTATYQATFQGLEGQGLSTGRALDIIELAVNLALQARDKFAPLAPTHRRTPLVAASIGPYGAYLADGSEYVGRYNRSEDELAAFHEDRFEVLATSGADLIACETIPSLPEAKALASLIGAHGDDNAWISFTCRDERHISDGTPIAECARCLDEVPNLIAIGINCTSPSLIPSLVREIRTASDKPVIVYPNSGERFDPDTRQWLGPANPAAFAGAAEHWLEAGATIIGGCCRTTPAHIRALRDQLAP